MAKVTGTAARDKNFLEMGQALWQISDLIHLGKATDDLNYSIGSEMDIDDLLN